MFLLFDINFEKPKYRLLTSQILKSLFYHGFMKRSRFLHVLKQSIGKQGIGCIKIIFMSAWSLGDRVDNFSHKNLVVLYMVDFSFHSLNIKKESKIKNFIFIYLFKRSISN